MFWNVGAIKILGSKNAKKNPKKKQKKSKNPTNL